MGVFRYNTKYAAPTWEQRERYMKGDYEEHFFGPDNQILVIIYDEAAYLKDDIEGTRVFFTGHKDKEKVMDEVRRLIEEHANKEDGTRSFMSARDIK
jgi:hypothetical protein